MTVIIFFYGGVIYAPFMELETSGIIFKTNIEIAGAHASDKELEVREVINDDRRRVLEISIRASGVLKRHRAAEPITVLCVKGEGRFSAGAELDEIVALTNGTIVALGPDIDHEVNADTDLRILVTRFK